MALFITSLNSGSNANCYYVGKEEEGILIDAGLSCGETEKRLKRLGLQITNIKAIFVSHEHSDHILGIPVIARKYQIPVYITPVTYRESRMHLGKKLVCAFQTQEPVAVGGLLVIPFSKWHDAADPHSFIVSCEDVTVGVFTDIGKPCDQVIAHFRKCDAAFLETNYDEERLMNGKYPYYLKNRIRGEKGHLSNHQALELFQSHRPAFMSHLLLSHLSKENNSPEIAAAVFANHAGNTKIIVASRDRETEIFRIIHEKHSAMPAGPVFHQPRQTQLTLF